MARIIGYWWPCVAVGIRSFSTTGTGSVLVAAASPTLSGTIGGNLTFSGNDIHTAALKIDLNAASLPTAQTGAILQAGNVDGTASRIEIDGFANTAYVSGVRYDGTNASPTTLQLGDEIGGYNAWGWDGAAVPLKGAA